MPVTITHSGIESAARECLGHPLLIERAARLASLARWITGFDELRATACSRKAVEAAAWFHDAWCVEGIRDGRFNAALVLAEPPAEVQRLRSAEFACECLQGLLDDVTLATAADALRAAGRRDTRMPEAWIIAEAADLDSIGPLWLWGQAARCNVESRSIGQVIGLWERHVEYRYWPKRIAETLRFERSRRLARHRCESLDAFMLGLRDQLACGDRHVAPPESAG